MFAAADLKAVDPTNADCGHDVERAVCQEVVMRAVFHFVEQGCGLAGSREAAEAARAYLQSGW